MSAQTHYPPADASTQPFYGENSDQSVQPDSHQPDRFRDSRFHSCHHHTGVFRYTEVHMLQMEGHGT